MLSSPVLVCAVQVLDALFLEGVLAFLFAAKRERYSCSLSLPRMIARSFTVAE